MTVLLRDDFTGSGTLVGRTPDGVHTGTWADDSYFGGTASNTSVAGGVLVPLTPYRFGASIAMAGPPTNAYIEAGMLTTDITYPAGAKTILGLGTTIGSATVGVFCAFTRTFSFGSTYITIDLTTRHSDFASGTTSLIDVPVTGSDFRVRLEVQGTAVAVLVDGRYVMRAVLNSVMAAGRAFIGSEFASTTVDWVQAGFLPTYTKPPLLNLTGTILLDLITTPDMGGLQYQPPEFAAGAFTGQNLYSTSADDSRQGGWAINAGAGSVARGATDTIATAYYGGGAAALSEITADLIFRTAEGFPTFTVSDELVRLSWNYGPTNNETYDVSVNYLIAADAITLVGGGAVAGFYLVVKHYAPTAGVNPAVSRYTLLPTIHAEEVHHFRIDQFRSAVQQYYFDDVLIDTATKPTASGVHKLNTVEFVNNFPFYLMGTTTLLEPPMVIGGVRIMAASSLAGPPYFWRDLITCVETR